MEALNTRVQKGIYPKIPSFYSEDLSSIIALLLQVSAKSRPSCDELLQNRILAKKQKELLIEEAATKVDLLGTIILPKNLKILREKLPKPHYERNTYDDEEWADPEQNAIEAPQNRSLVTDIGQEDSGSRHKLKDNQSVNCNKYR